MSVSESTAESPTPGLLSLDTHTPTKTNKVDSPPSRDAVAKRAHVFRTETKQKAVHKRGEPVWRGKCGLWPSEKKRLRKAVVCKE